MAKTRDAKAISFRMSRVASQNTDIERLVRSKLHRRGYRFRKHAKELPGKPDIVFPKQKLAVFIDGDFWHGWRFPAWEHKVSDFWKKKIGKNRERDSKNFRKLRAMGWRVIRLWQHEIKQDVERGIAKIIVAVEESK